MSHDELFIMNKVLNEYDFPPLELLHFILVQMKLAQHYKGEFRITKRGTALLNSPAALFTAVIPFFLFEIDHAAYYRFKDGPLGNWDVWLNVLNIEVEDGASIRQLYKVLYGLAPDDLSGWRELGAFRKTVPNAVQTASSAFALPCPADFIFFNSDCWLRNTDANWDWLSIFSYANIQHDLFPHLI